MTGIDAVYTGGAIVTMNPGEPLAEAVAVAGTRIVATGTQRDIMKLAGSDTRRVDLAGATLMPGFIEAHGHPLMSALAWGEPVVDIRAIHTPTFDAAIEKIRRRVRKAAPGEVLWFIGLDPQLHVGMREPARAELDALAPDNPLVVQTSNFHALFINSRALSAFGIDRDTQAPKGGQIFHDADGLPWKFQESATLLLREKFYQMRGPVRAREALIDWLWKFADAGYTTSSEIGLMPEWTPHYTALLADAPMPIRVVGYERLRLDRMPVAQAPIIGKGGTDDVRFALRGVKLWGDGSPFVGNIWVTRPYLNTELTLQRMGLGMDNVGHMNWSVEDLRTLVMRSAAAGWQVATHVQGDRTIDIVLDCYEAALAAYPDAARPFRLEHCALIRADQIVRAHSLGVVCSFFLPHLYHWGEALRDGMFGADVVEQYMPSGTATRAGMRVSYHCDSPMTWPDALLCLHLALTRRTRLGAVIGADQRVGVEEALRAITIDAAWQLQMSDQIGSIEAGKQADFVLLGANPLTHDPERFLDIPILGTVLGGERLVPRERPEGRLDGVGQP